MKILVTGGQGYKGSVLVPLLLNHNWHVTTLDIGWFGDYLPDHEHLIKIKGDIRHLDTINLNDFSHIIHLANIANDPSVELAPSLSWDINVIATQQLIERAIHCGVKNFIYASSGSVYGISKHLSVTEETELLPLSVYNKTKMIAERVLLSYNDQINIYIVRPATVCGVSPRMRLDVAVNILTYQALCNGEIKLHGGEQIRPNIHIKDMASVYLHILDNKNMPSGIYNAGFQNLSLKEIAQTIQEKINCTIKIEQLIDPRSYRLCSDKIIDSGFSPLFSVNDAIDEIILAYNQKTLQIGPNTSTIHWMKKLITDGLITY